MAVSFSYLVLRATLLRITMFEDRSHPYRFEWFFVLFIMLLIINIWLGTLVLGSLTLEWKVVHGQVFIGYLLKCFNLLMLLYNAW